MPAPPRLALATATACALLASGAPALAAAPEKPPFRAVVRSLTPAERAAMTPSVWRPGCPVGLSRLRRVSLPYVDFSGRARRGALVVNASVARDVVAAFRTLYRAGFPIRRMRPIERYRGDDFASIEADNTSAFNCRPATGSSRWSQPRLWAGDRHQPDREPLRLRRPDVAPCQRAVPQPDPRAPRHGRGGARPGQGLRRPRLGLGRALVGHAGLPALLAQRPLGRPVPSLPLRLRPSAAELAGGFRRIRTELGIPEAFPAAAEAEAGAAAARPSDGPRADRRDIPLITIDPRGSRDLDQALAIAPIAGGHRVRYAIADVAALVSPGGPIDREAHRRGVTVYMPDRRAPLHPAAIGEGAASLLPRVDRPALLWTIDLDRDGEPAGVHLERATVRSRRAMSYVEAQAAIDGGSGDGTLPLLREVGMLRLAREAQRGGASLTVPVQEVVRDAGGYDLRYERTLPVEDWNAQISLLTGIAAASVMTEAGLGIFRGAGAGAGARPRVAAPQRPGARRAVARGRPVRRRRAGARAHLPGPPGLRRPGHPALPRRRLRRLAGRRRRAPGARGDRGPLRPRHRAPATPRRSLRQRDRPRPLRRPPPARVGAGRVGRRAGDHGRGRGT